MHGLKKSSNTLLTYFGVRLFSAARMRLNVFKTNWLCMRMAKNVQYVVFMYSIPVESVKTTFIDLERHMHVTIV